MYASERVCPLSVKAQRLKLKWREMRIVSELEQIILSCIAYVMKSVYICSS